MKAALALAFVTLTASAAMAATPDTSQSVYDRDVTCAGAADAVRLHVAPTGSPSENAKAAQFASLTLDAAQADGAKLGRTKEQVGAAVDRQRDAALAPFAGADAAKTKREEGDLGRLLIDCALVHAIATK